MNGSEKRGFTLVEAVIVVVVIALILTLTIPWVRGRERERLEALAESEPWEVFEFRAAAAKEVFSEDEEIVILCEIVNFTNHPLMLPIDYGLPVLTFGDTDYWMGHGAASYVSIKTIFKSRKTPILPGETVSFEAKFPRMGTGKTEVRIAYLLNKRSGWSGRNSGTNTQIGALVDRDRFQSNAFSMIVAASDNSGLRTFDVIVDGIERSERYYAGMRSGSVGNSSFPN